MALALSFKGDDMTRYIAKHSIGQFMPGDEIKGLDAKRIQALLVSKAIEEFAEPVEEQKGDINAELNAMLLQLTTERDALLKENAELKVKVESFVQGVAITSNQTAFEPLAPADGHANLVHESVAQELQQEAKPDVVVSKPKGRPPKVQTETANKAE